MREELAKAQTIFALHWRVGAKTFSPLGATPFLVEDNSALHASLTVMSAFSAPSLSGKGAKSEGNKRLLVYCPDPVK